MRRESGISDLKTTPPLSRSVKNLIGRVPPFPNRKGSGEGDEESEGDMIDEEKRGGA